MRLLFYTVMLYRGKTVVTFVLPLRQPITTSHPSFRINCRYRTTQEPHISNFGRLLISKLYDLI